MKLAFALGMIVVGCAAPRHPSEPAMDPQGAQMMASTSMPMDDGAGFGPLAVGADYASYVQMNTSPVSSETHGGRLVDTYVNRIGAAAYLDADAELPVGTVIVKTSAEVKDGRATGEAGPIFGPPSVARHRAGGPIYWRSPSPKVGYCVECHDNYDRNLGDVPGPQKLTALPE